MTPEAQLLREWFGCRKAGAGIIAMLYAAEGQSVPRAVIAKHLGLTLNTFHQELRQARLVMDPGSIASRTNVGIHLTAVGMEDCRRALADARARQAA